MTTRYLPSRRAWRVILLTSTTVVEMSSMTGDSQVKL
jgi:hypothetical protein